MNMIATRESFGKALEELGEENGKIVVLDADLYNSTKTEEFKNSPANRLMELMKQVCATNGYYEKFIPAIRKLSPLYNEYYEQMIKANEQFIKNYPEYTE